MLHNYNEVSNTRDLERRYDERKNHQREVIHGTNKKAAQYY